jgi:glutamate synthase domain-containing protein 1
MICDLKGRKFHRIVSDGLQILCNLSHRGGVACDGSTGDGAGILIQIPHDFFHKVADAIGIRLPAAGRYGSGLIFLPREPDEQRRCMREIERITAEARQTFLGWRRVPVDSRAIGDIFRQAEPVLRQAFIARGPRRCTKKASVPLFRSLFSERITLLLDTPNTLYISTFRQAPESNNWAVTIRNIR